MTRAMRPLDPSASASTHPTEKKPKKSAEEKEAPKVLKCAKEAELTGGALLPPTAEVAVFFWVWGVIGVLFLCMYGLVDQH